MSAAPRVLVPVFQVRVWRGCGVGMAWAWRGHGVGMACAWYECAAGYRTTPTRRSRRYTGPPFTACRALPSSRTRAVTAAASASSRPKLLIESRSGSRSPRRRSLVKSRIVHFFLILLYIHCTVHGSVIPSQCTVVAQSTFSLTLASRPARYGGDANWRTTPH